MQDNMYKTLRARLESVINSLYTFIFIWIVFLFIGNKILSCFIAMAVPQLPDTETGKYLSE
jgi:hypothetical protein